MRCAIPALRRCRKLGPSKAVLSRPVLATRARAQVRQKPEHHHRATLCHCQRAHGTFDCSAMGHVQVMERPYAGITALMDQSISLTKITVPIVALARNIWYLASTEC